MPAIGVALEAIADGTSGRIMMIGLIENINTAGIAAGTRVWVSSTVAGGIQITAPVWPALRQEIATILVQDALVGTAQVKAHSAQNDALIDHAALMNLTAGDPHTQYQLESTQLTSIITSATPQTLTDQAAIDWNLASGGAAKVTLGGDRTLNEASNKVNGAHYSLRIIQDGTGTRLLTWHATYRFPGGVEPALSAAANNIDILLFVSDGTYMDCVGMVSAVA